MFGASGDGLVWEQQSFSMSAMTVESNVLQQHALQNQDQIINQLKEITGIHDVQTLQKAYSVSHGDVSQAVQLLTSETTTDAAPTQVVPVGEVSDPTPAIPDVQYGPKTKSQAAGVIDLTNEGDDKADLRRAIALSLQETQTPSANIGVSAEEQDISRALEESLAETKHGAKRKRGEGWFVDPLNPHERQRENGWPVGLKNVGNTCWFSAVIQSLFHLPLFRHLVLEFKPIHPKLENATTPEDIVECRNLIFMNELRSLFALMVGTQRKYVDPSGSVQILKAAFSSNSSEQQDVSEFTHKLLEWLEDAFKASISRKLLNRDEASNKVDDQDNPMLQLFYGQFRAEGINEGKVFSNQETFGQYPLQVNGFDNLHESLEAATAHLKIESVNSDTASQSGQEHWFTQLPPVLTFELSRFHFNQHLGRPEKIHNKLVFPQIIYMDRYMECNKDKTRILRERIKGLRQQLQELCGRLERFLNYGTGAKRFPLMDVLQYALEFASSKTPVVGENSDMSSPKPTPFNPDDVEMCTPPRTTLDISMGSVTESPNNSPNKVNLQDSAMQSTAISPFQAAGDDVKMEETTTPSPKHITDTELNVLQSCLRRWRTEVESDVRALQDHIHKIRQTIDDMYEEEDLRKCPYLLHAVLVHEGQASAGHYWAYIRNHIHEKWLKFNDISVVDVSWEELQRESAGGSGNASAYCLMYVDGNNTELFATQDGETGHTLLSLDSLALDLKQLVLEDNQKFMKEMEEWDEDQLRKAAGIGYEEVTVASEQRATTTSILKQPRQSQCRERELKKDKETLPVKHRDTEYEPLRRNKEQYDGQEQFTVKSSRDVKKLDLSLPEMQPIITERRRVREDQFDKVSHPANYRAQTGTIATVSQSQIVPSSPAGTVEAPPMSPPASSVGLETEHNKLTFERSTLALERVKSIYHKSGAEEALKQAYEDEFQMLQKLADSFDSLSPKQDLRLKSGVIYFLKNTTPAFVIERTIYEQFSYKGLCFDNSCKSIKKAAMRKMDSMPLTTDQLDRYQKWHDQYSTFRKAAGLFAMGLECYHNKENYMEALPYFVYSYKHNEVIHPKTKYSSLDENLVSLYRRECLLQLNDQCAQAFEADDQSEADFSLKTVEDYVVPCLGILSNSEHPEDSAAAEDIRDRWYSLLGQEINASLQEKFQDFLPKLIDVSADVCTLKMPPLSRLRKSHDLAERYAEMMELVISSGLFSTNNLKS